MNSRKISIIVLIMGTDEPYSKTITQIEAACDLNDLEFKVFDLSQEYSELEARFYGSMKKDIIYIADFTNIVENPSKTSINILMLANAAAWVYEKPLIAILNTELTKILPFGWEKYDQVLNYTTEEIKGLKKPLAKKILEFTEIIESSETVQPKQIPEFIKDEPKTESDSQRKQRLGVDNSIGKKADAEASKQQELNKLLKQRFREQMLTDITKSPDELEEEAASKIETKQPGMLRAPEGGDNKPRAPKGMRQIAEEMKDDDFKSPENEELKKAIDQAKPKEKSRLLELQEKYQQKIKQLELEDQNLDLDLKDESADSTISQKLKAGPRTGIGFLQDMQSNNKVQLCKNELTIGRHPENDIFIADMKVSKRHAVILRGVDKCYYIQDLESKHGTLLKDKKLEDMEPLSDGDEIAIGLTDDNSGSFRRYKFTQQIS
ncbi:MAG: FHA domain-containing protein [Planctomycetes bacterium]|nr:FHA domain-containing protein [Planctomycetota bacterium]